jgi:hypothetical protein
MLIDVLGGFDSLEEMEAVVGSIGSIIPEVAT